MEKLNLGILYGGQSTEHEVSMRSAESVLGALDRKKYTIHLIYISKQGEWLLADQSERIEAVVDKENGHRLSILPSQQFADPRPKSLGHRLLRRPACRKMNRRPLLLQAVVTFFRRKNTFQESVAEFLHRHLDALHLDDVDTNTEDLHASPGYPCMASAISRTACSRPVVTARETML